MNTQNIGDLIKQLAKNGEEVYSLPCKVVSIDSDNLAELEPLNGDPNLLGVRLTAGASDTPFLVTPVIGSAVIATFLSRNTAFISLYSEIESVEIRGSDFGGLIKIEEAVNKFNRLENKVNDLITKFNTHTHIYAPGPLPPVPTAPTVAPEVPIMPTTLKSDLENQNVKHG
jgi:hypothetical protein